ncbi:MAG: LuxR C-terminal-related transcriptional regulator, partial [Actinomycetota bacterium]|nr:LuxR C-terminal-related transcriptional regulator [Actinomycetota bacterium]
LEARLGVLRSFVPAQRRVAAEHLHQFADLSGDTPEQRTLLALLGQRGRYHSDPYLEVADFSRRALADGALFDDAARGEGLVSWVLAMMSLITAEGTEEGRAEVSRARLRVSRGGSPVDYAMVINADMLLSWRTGDVTTTETDAESILAAISHEPPGPEVVSLRATATNFACFTAMERRDLGAARALLAEFDATRGGIRVVPTIWLYEVRSRVALADDDPHGALRHLETLRRELDDAGVDPASLAWRLPAAIAYSRIGEEERAQEALVDHVALTRRWGAPTDLGAALRVAARFERDAEARAEQLAAAIEVLEQSHDRLELAKSLVDQAETWRALGRRTDAREGLTYAADIVAACGAPAVENRIAEALAAIGDRPRRAVALGAGSLTASERRVASLAISGRSNRDIAQELFVSPKTVENHLGRVYSKLGIGNRRELAGALG